MQQDKRFQNFLLENRLKKTSQRTFIWNTLVHSKDHPSVEEIRARLLEKGHRIGLSTVYRTLKILLESGMIRQTKMKGTIRYEPLISQPNHIHFVCNRCGATDEFASRRIEQLIREETNENDFQPVYSRYALFGFCHKCGAIEAREASVEAKQRQLKIIARDALELTLALERRGYHFYTNASKKTKDPTGRKMFEDLAKEESEHMDRLQQEYRTLLEEHRWLRREPRRLSVNRDVASQMFSARQLSTVEVQDTMTHMEALGLAIDLEKKSHQIFSDFAKKLDDQHGRKIFRDFAREERSHLEDLRNEYARLSQDSTDS